MDNQIRNREGSKAYTLTDPIKSNASATGKHLDGGPKNLHHVVLDTETTKPNVPL